MHVLDEKRMNLRRRLKARTRIPRAYERAFDDFRCKGSRVLAELRARFGVQRGVLHVKHLPQRFLVCESDTGRYGSMRTAIARVERGRHEASLG